MQRTAGRGAEVSSGEGGKACALATTGGPGKICCIFRFVCWFFFPQWLRLQQLEDQVRFVVRFDLYVGFFFPQWLRLQELEDQVRFVVRFDLYVCFFFLSGCAYIKTVLLIICGHGLG
jgi:hypothetical protein